MIDFVNNIEFLEYKAPKDFPDVNSRYINSAEQTNVCVTQQLRNAMTLSGVELPNTVTRSDAIDPLFLAKTIQHYASFAQTYTVDPSSTENNIIITPSTQNIQLQTVSLESNGSEIVVNTNNIDGLVDAQVFDDLPNGAIFQFIPSLSNTSSTINLTVRIKRLKWDVGTLSQIVETKDFLYPVKDIDSITSLNNGDIVSGNLIIVHFDSSENVFKLVNKSIQQATETLAGTIYLNKPIALTYSSTTTLLYSAGTFQFDDGTGQGVVTSGSAVITSFYPTPTNNTAYYLFAVKNLTTNATTVIISSSKTSPTLPSGFTKKAYIGSLMTNASGQIRSGKWFDGNKRFEYASRSFDHAITTPIATRTPYGLMAPPLTHAIFNASIDDSDDTNTDVIFTSYWQDDLAPTQTNGLSDFANGGLRANSIELTRELNTSRQIYVRTDVVANSTLYLTTLGWLELF